MSRGDLKEVEWHILRVLLSVEREPGKRGRGRPPEDNRNIINGILWRLRTGAPWRDVPEKYGNWKLDLSTLSTMVRLRHLGERSHRPRENDDRERALQHRQHDGWRSCLGSGQKRGFIDELLAARGRVHQ